MPQGILPFNYSPEHQKSGVTSLGGLPSYLELGHVLGLAASIDKHLNVRSGGQGYTDRQVIIPLIMMNLAGGNCVDDLARLEDDPGFQRLLGRVEFHDLPRKERRKMQRRWRKERTRCIPSASSVFRYLTEFCQPEEEDKRGYGQAFIPAPSEGLQGLWKVNADLIAAVQERSCEEVATLDMDATLVEVEKKEALKCYKHFPAYQPLNVWWAEQELMVHSEFRDGNVPAAFENLRVLEEALEMLPESVKKVRFRADTAGYQRDLLLYLAAGKSERFGKIEFTIGADVTKALKAEVARLGESEWKNLQRQNPKTREWEDTCYEWAEVVFVPNWLAHSKKNPELRFLVTRKCLSQQPLPEMAEQMTFSFPAMTMGSGDIYQMYAVVTNLDAPGDEVIRWHRERCGKSEEAHAIQKSDLAGGRLPSKHFGANAAWWAIMILALNLNSAMKRLVLAPALGKSWLTRRLKAIRFLLISLPGRVVDHARELWVKIGGQAALEQIRLIRQQIVAIA